MSTSAGNPTVCPKCTYTRTAADRAPAWQCPSCGIAYIKFKDAAKAEAQAAGRKDGRRLAESTGQSDKVGAAALTFYAATPLLFSPLFYFVQHLGWMKWLPVLLAAGAFVFWLGAYRRMRVVADVPTSTIAAAAQGYVELHGTALAAPGHALVGHLTRAPCVWYHYLWYRPGDSNRNGGNDEGTRGAPFILRDATGDCLIDLDQAEVICNRCEKWFDGQTVFNEWSIRVGDPVYAIGHFTSDGTAVEAHVNMQVACALAAQERDAAAYAGRHDSNRDGKVDRQETSIAREALRREIAQQLSAQGGAHVLSRPADGRPFLIIGARHAEVVRRYRRLAMGHLLAFLVATACAGYVWSV